MGRQVGIISECWRGRVGCGTLGDAGSAGGQAVGPVFALLNVGFLFTLMGIRLIGFGRVAAISTAERLRFRFAYAQDRRARSLVLL